MFCAMRTRETLFLAHVAARARAGCRRVAPTVERAQVHEHAAGHHVPGVGADSHCVSSRRQAVRLRRQAGWGAMMPPGQGGTPIEISASISSLEKASSRASLARTVSAKMIALSWSVDKASARCGLAARPRR